MLQRKEPGPLAILSVKGMQSLDGCCALGIRLKVPSMAVSGVRAGGKEPKVLERHCQLEWLALG